MIGVITKIDVRRGRAVVSAPYLARTVRLHKQDFQSEILPFDSRLIGKPITFDLLGNRAVNAWACSCDFMDVAADNLTALETSIT